jgi:hypothetical protein
MIWHVSVVRRQYDFGMRVGTSGYSKKCNSDLVRRAHHLPDLIGTFPGYAKPLRLAGGPGWHAPGCAHNRQEEDMSKRKRNTPGMFHHLLQWWILTKAGGG